MGYNFNKNYWACKENMMNFALMLTANRDDAQDLLQDTTLKVLDNQDKFVDNVNFKGWVLTVMRIFSLTTITRLYVYRQSSTQVQTYTIWILSMIQDLIHRIRHIRSRKSQKQINGLNDDLKVPFSMFLSGYKYNEIA